MKLFLQDPAAPDLQAEEVWCPSRWPGFDFPDPKDPRYIPPWAQPWKQRWPKLSWEKPSIGSIGHYVGDCKPCAFVHGKGCLHGGTCRFCHICDCGEKRRRQKANKASFRLGFLALIGIEVGLHRSSNKFCFPTSWMWPEATYAGVADYALT